MSRILTENQHPFLSAPRRYVTDAELELMLKIFNREDSLHLSRISLEWNTMHGTGVKAKFYCDEDIPINRSATLYKQESWGEWKCIASDKDMADIVLFVESKLQEAMEEGHWTRDEEDYPRFVSNN